MLPDDVLLEMFDIYVVEAIAAYEELKDQMEAWQKLVHVCRRWRSVVFGSPRRLNLQLVCAAKASARDTLDVWPSLPLVIDDDNCQKEGLIALLERSEIVSRICQIELWKVRLEDSLEVMEVPFPELTYLLLNSDETEPVVPLSDSFLGGYTPRLRYLHFECIPFPGLPKLLLSATHLTNLRLYHIPHSGYISPEAMVACLSLLTSLGVLCLGFKSPQSRPDQESRHPPPSTRTVLSVLKHFSFRGVDEYLEDLVARIDAPRLNSFKVTFFNDIVFDTPQVTQFISRTPQLETLDKASVFLWDLCTTIELSSETFGDGELSVRVLCEELDWQVSSLEQVFTSSLPPLSALEDLYIINHRSPRNWGDLSRKALRSSLPRDRLPVTQ